MKKPLSEMSLEELWQLFPIQLTEYKPIWNDWFSEEKNYLSSLLPQNCLIHHIGSTSIKGIWAKPIIDLLIEANLSDFSKIKTALLNQVICQKEKPI